jgi:hypothetical protein
VLHIFEGKVSEITTEHLKRTIDILGRYRKEIFEESNLHDFFTFILAILRGDHANEM